MPEQAYKRCGKCGHTKPTTEFSLKRKRSPDGLQPWCKECNLVANRKWRRKNPDKSAANSRRNYENHRKEKHALMDAHKKRHPEKAHARKAVREALRSGKLVRPSSCEGCGSTDVPLRDGRSSLHAHHADYSKPLEVEWLCLTCHRARHAS